MEEIPKKLRSTFQAHGEEKLRKYWQKGTLNELAGVGPSKGKLIVEFFEQQQAVQAVPQTEELRETVNLFIYDTPHKDRIKNYDDAVLRYEEGDVVAKQRLLKLHESIQWLRSLPKAMSSTKKSALIAEWLVVLAR